MTSFLAAGGDGFDFLKGEIVNHTVAGNASCTVNYVLFLLILCFGFNNKECWMPTRQNST